MCKLKKTLLMFALLSVITILFPLLSAGRDSSTNEYLTRTGKAILIIESHPVGQGLSDIKIKSSGFEHNLIETLNDLDPIKNVHIADLDKNGFDEFYIITVSSGSGSYGNIIAFASDRDKSLSMIHFPEVEKGDERFTGYMGHDHFQISENVLIRSFPIYLPSDKNANPTGGTQTIAYRLFPSEASWQLKIVDSSHTR